MRIKDISVENRPRERLEKQGVTALSDAELLAVILKTGNRNENVIDMSNRLLAKYGIAKLSSCSLKELQAINGIGSAKASQILALFEFNKRHNLAKQNGKPLRSAKDVFNYMQPKLAQLDRERFMVLHLDTKNCTLKEEVVSIGTLNGAIVHPRELFKSAIKENANSVILVHNHPSGDPTPSQEDVEVTERVMEAGKVLGIDVLDHVIIGNETYWSFKESRR